MRDIQTNFQTMKIAVGIATAGRRKILSETLARICRQSRLPDRLIVCPAADDDCDTGLDLPVKLEIAAAPRGLTAQRNAILDAASDMDFVAFFDDDFFPAYDYLALLEAEILLRPSMAMVTGSVLADDITGPGLSVRQADEILKGSRSVDAASAVGHMTIVYNAYGCNMVVNMAKAVAAGARFDEALPLYGWLEDVDFSRTLARFGEILKSPALRGVHLGTKAGRTSGVRFGYSQIANPIYLWRKGTLTLPRALTQLSKNVLANTAKVLHPEPWVDRSGRLRGNAIAAIDLVAGRMAPNRILGLAAGAQLASKRLAGREPA